MRETPRASLAIEADENRMGNRAWRAACVHPQPVTNCRPGRIRPKAPGSSNWLGGCGQSCVPRDSTLLDPAFCAG
jgi:hypothetical protein